ncbi:MAG: ectoine/hydroxyectoine ABC transporter permease subunit EhuC [Gammaproteobacteria bacterium]|nr:ectoine/hydroxyectoine ABC transporter permease subunit EhuC [Gammaproteobacteria bacterium]NIR84951.1 ectoine/hydroxyectoine ABC transporter permease subunit EhuC [Gammaproteobacteria bacterium]NIR91800.1 ectoine/hydroxyectoine ABC transporter permease subunit EhuC [Gammaproteobacteria bacterium]NIU05998.1 ectoine/hydroxyectoine ABC transporter permease subunit EhuC [Gammaproteobacteria bacterium]NIV53045.1 ectoine/hydroxyectoine ABC transporter permease subunit EhuC [Gammaproteobacteria ba
MLDLLGPLLRGMAITGEIFVGAALVAIFFGLFIGLLRISPVWPLKWLAVAYIEIFRGTSLLVQLFWWFFVLPQFGIFLAPLVVGIFGVGMNVGGYGAEVVRGAIQAVPKAQYETATALNMSPGIRMRRVILPQAFRAMLPPWGNLLIELLKGTSLVSLITIHDLTFMGNQLNITTFRTIEVFTLVLILYFILARGVITPTVRWFERRVSRGVVRGV